jgi:hypothetical protein
LKDGVYDSVEPPAEEPPEEPRQQKQYVTRETIEDRGAVVPFHRPAPPQKLEITTITRTERAPVPMTVETRTERVQVPMTGAIRTATRLIDTHGITAMADAARAFRDNPEVAQEVINIASRQRLIV